MKEQREAGQTVVLVQHRKTVTGLRARANDALSSEGRKRMNIQRNPAIAHFKEPVDFIPYCEGCLIANTAEPAYNRLQGIENIVY